MSRSLSVKCLLSQQQAVLFPSLTFSVLKCVSVCKTEALHTQADCGTALLCCTEGPAHPDFTGNEDNGTIRHLVRGENTHQQQAKVAFFNICFVTFLFALIYLREDLSGTCREWMSWWWSVKWPLKHWPFIPNTPFGVEIRVKWV